MENKKSNAALIWTIIGIVAAVGAAVFAIIHFWDDIKKLLPGKKEEDIFEDLDEFEELEAPEV